MKITTCKMISDAVCHNKYIQIHTFWYKKKTLSVYIIFTIVSFFLNSSSSSFSIKFTVFLPQTRIRHGCLLLMNQWHLQVALKQIWYSNGGWLVWNLSFLTGITRTFFDGKQIQRRVTFCARLHAFLWTLETFSLLQKQGQHCRSRGNINR